MSQIIGQGSPYLDDSVIDSNLEHDPGEEGRGQLNVAFVHGVTNLGLTLFSKEMSSWYRVKNC
jgi:hypothetical protein